ncbi:MAG: hypothetical protein C0445_08895 [Polaromonas sp.]|nr:hypothetical protein [Polaromonas sp.]
MTPEAMRQRAAPFRLVTFNTWKCDGAYALRLQAMTRQLGLLAPDVVALQECFASADGALDTAGHLARALGLHSVVAQARPKTRLCDGVSTPSRSGMALLSRWPVRAHLVLPLPSDPADGERTALLCQLDAGPRTLTVANVHLTHLPWAQAMRQQQLRTVLDHPWMRVLTDALVVCGDFNAPLHADEIRHFTVPSGVWVDAPRAAGLHPKTTCPADHGPRADLDHVLSHAATPLRWRGAFLALNQPDGATGVWASDHVAVCVDGELLP